MNKASETSQNRQFDAQSLQSAQNRQVDTQSLQSTQILTAQRASPLQSQQQNRSASQAERSGRSDRQRIQRSNSSTSSRSGGSAGAAAGVRAEGVVTAGSYQQYSSEGASAYAANNGSFGSAASGERRQGRYRRQVIRLPDQAQGQVRQVRRRLPTPEPNTLERVYIQRTAGEVVEEITEIPTTPPPRIQERTVVEPAGPPQVIKHTIRVPPRGGSYGGYPQQQQQQQQQQQGGNFQTGGSVISGGSYSSIPQATTSYQQQGGTSYSGGYSAGPIPYAGAYGSFGTGGGGVYQQQPQQAPIVFTVGGAGSSQPLPPVGCHPAFCFYV